MKVPPLSAEAVAEMARGSRLDAEGLHRTTRGNPFYVGEILAAGTGLPESVRDAVLARAARLSAGARAYLDAAAVIGDRIELALLERVETAPRAGLDEALGGGMLQRSSERQAVPALLAFRHDLARQALLDVLPVSRRRDLHRRVLAALAGDAGALAAPDTLALLAYHAEGAGDAEAVLRYAPAAAEHARSLQAHREAAGQYERALRSAGRGPDAERARLATAFAEACVHVDRLEDAERALTSAVALWRNVGDADRQGEVLAKLAEVRVLSGRNSEAERASAAALELLSSRPPGRALALATLAQATLRMLDRDGAEGVRWSERAIALAERFGDAAVLARATNTLGSSLLVAGDLEHGRERLERSLAIADTAGIFDGVASALINLGSGLGELHRFATANDYLERSVAYCREHDLDFNRSYALAWLALVRLALGRWDEAAGAAHEVLARPQAAISTMMANVALGRLRARRGDPDAWGPLDAALKLAEPTETLQRLAPVRAARAEAAWLAGDTERTLTEVEADDALIAQHRHPWFLGELSYWRWKAGAPTGPPDGIAEPYGLQIAGRPRAAAEAWTALGCPYEAARALAESDDPADRTEALATFEELGARPMIERLRGSGGENGVAPSADEAPFVRLFGPPAVRFGGDWHHPPYGKTAALLYHLAYRGDWVSRSDLILLLWADVSDRRARASLRNLLSHSARTLPFAAGLEVEPQRVRWRVGTDRSGSREGEADGPPGSGLLLDGFQPPDLPEFDRWLEGERAALSSERRTSALARTQLLADEDPGGAAAVLAPLLDDDPLDEAIVRLVLGYLRAAGRGVEAAQRYRRFRDLLRDRVGAEPAPETEALIADLL
jgi:DNA-binding SARP family transcriptional activator